MIDLIICSKYSILLKGFHCPLLLNNVSLHAMILLLLIRSVFLVIIPWAYDSTDGAVTHVISGIPRGLGSRRFNCEE